MTTDAASTTWTATVYRVGYDEPVEVVALPGADRPRAGQTIFVHGQPWTVRQTWTARDGHLVIFTEKKERIPT